MEIRMLVEEELQYASGLSRYVFDTCLRNRMEFTQTIPFVENYISESNLKEMYRENRLVVWGAFEQGQLVGVAGMQTDGLITLLYVLPQYMRRNCGMHLLTVMRGYAQEMLHLEKVIVNATPAWTSTYFKKNGFALADAKQNMHVPFVKMEALSKDREFQKKEKISWKIIVGAISACVGFATIASVWFMISYLLG
jgi:N-acetylglutamate synthase-like GNAT family acetyltransferase